MAPPKPNRLVTTSAGKTRPGAANHETAGTPKRRRIWFTCPSWLRSIFHMTAVETVPLTMDGT